MSYADFYLKHVQGSRVEGKSVNGRCPFHDDGTPSFSAFVDSGVWACFGACNLKGRSPEEFVARKMKVSLTEAASILASEVAVSKVGPRTREKEQDEPDKIVPADAVAEKHEALLSNDSVLADVTALRRWSLETIKTYSIGWDAKDNRIWIPVPGREGWADVRRYDWKHLTDRKFLAYAAGYGKPRPYPHPPQPEDDILLVEGEPDCLLARSLGFNAYSSTGGAGSPTPLSAKRVTILFDADEAGVNGASKARVFLARTCGTVRVLEMPKWAGMPKGADFTDYVKAGLSLDELRAEIAALWKPEEDSAPKVSLSQAITDSNYGKLLKVSAVASGKNLTPYQVPRRGVVVCPNNLPICKRCGINESAGQHQFEIKQDSQKLIECADEPSPRVRAILREHLGIPRACSSNELEVQDVQNLYSVRLTSLVDLGVSTDKNPYIAIQSWSTEPIDLNTPFVFTGRAMPDPKTQAGTLLINKVDSDRTSIDDFSLSSEQNEALKAFQP